MSLVNWTFPSDLLAFSNVADAYEMDQTHFVSDLVFILRYSVQAPKKRYPSLLNALEKLCLKESRTRYQSAVSY